MLNLFIIRLSRKCNLDNQCPEVYKLLFPVLHHGSDCIVGVINLVMCYILIYSNLLAINKIELYF